MLSPRHTTKKERWSLTFPYHDNISTVIKSTYRYTSQASPLIKEADCWSSKSLLSMLLSSSFLKECYIDEFVMPSSFDYYRQGGPLFHLSLQIKEEQHLIVSRMRMCLVCKYFQCCFVATLSYWHWHVHYYLRTNTTLSGPVTRLAKCWVRVIRTTRG